MFSPPFLPCPELLKPASAGDGLAGSIRDGGVFEEVVNLVSRVSTEKSLPAYCSKLMTCWTLHVLVMGTIETFRVKAAGNRRNRQAFNAGTAAGLDLGQQPQSNGFLLPTLPLYFPYS